MLALLFYVKDVMYTVKCDQIREIAPMVHLKEVPHSPPFFAGYFNFRGRIIPVIDLSQLIAGEPCEIRLSTRIILADYPSRKRDGHILGLMAERVTETLRKPEAAFVPPSIRSKTAPYLGGIVMDEDRMIQYLELPRLPDCIDFLPESDEDAEAADDGGGAGDDPDGD
jgi:chemotaxis-related protein WspB